MHLIFYDFNFPPHYMQSSSSSRASWLGVWARRRGRTWRLLWQLHYGLWQVGINSEEDRTVGTLLLYCYGCWWIVGILHFIVAMGHYHVCSLVLLFFGQLFPVYHWQIYRIVGNFQGRKLSWIWWLFAKVFSMKFGGMAPLALQKRPIHESFLHENSSFPQFTKFSKSKVFRYMVLWWIVDTLMYKCMYVMLLTIGLIFMPPLGDPSFCWGWS